MVKDITSKPITQKMVMVALGGLLMFLLSIGATHLSAWQNKTEVRIDKKLDKDIFIEHQREQNEQFRNIDSKMDTIIRELR